jgi:hypothetical protein
MNKLCYDSVNNKDTRNSTNPLKEIKMRKLLIATVLLSSIALAGPTLSYAKHGGDNCQKCEQKCKASKIKKELKDIWKHNDLLNLTKDQMTKLKDIKHSAIKNIIKLTADVDIITVDLKSEMWEATHNQSALTKLVAKKYDAKEKIAMEYIKAISDINATLTEDQRNTLLEIKVNKYINGDCLICASKSKCSKCTATTKCAKCAAKSGAKICPLTGKTLESKGSGHDK